MLYFKLFVVLIRLWIKQVVYDDKIIPNTSILTRCMFRISFRRDLTLVAMIKE